MVVAGYEGAYGKARKSYAGEEATNGIGYASSRFGPEEKLKLTRDAIFNGKEYPAGKN